MIDNHPPIAVEPHGPICDQRRQQTVEHLREALKEWFGIGLEGPGPSDSLSERLSVHRH